MIAVDQNEDRNQPELVNYLRQSVEVQVGAYNQTSGSNIVYPDFVIWGGSQLVGINRKTCNEVFSSVDKVEEQLLRELAGPVEQLALVVEGVAVPDGIGGAWVYSFDFSNIKLWKSDQVGSAPFHRQHYRQTYSGVMNWLTRLGWLGIQVIPSVSVIDTATKLVAMHELVMKGEESRTLNRLIKTKHPVLALDKQERDMAMTLMGVEGGGCGEEIALTIAGSFGSITELVRYWDDNGSIADLMLRSGTRRVGHAAEKKIQSALGWTGSPDLRLRQEPGETNSNVYAAPAADK